MGNHQPTGMQSLGVDGIQSIMQALTSIIGPNPEPLLNCALVCSEWHLSAKLPAVWTEVLGHATCATYHNGSLPLIASAHQIVVALHQSERLFQLNEQDCSQEGRWLISSAGAEPSLILAA